MFFIYSHFLLIIVSFETKEEHLKGCGLVEAKVRHLGTILERNGFIRMVHANPEIFELSPECCKKTSPNSVFAVGMEFHQLVAGASIDLTTKVQKFTDVGKYTYWRKIVFVYQNYIKMTVFTFFPSFLIIVMRHAISNNIYSETSRIETKYVKK